MANKDHLSVLKEGVVVWNKWRKDNTEVRPDLSYADLVGTNLSDANLRNAKLFKVNLSKADLSNTKLSNADLRSAELNSALLNNAVLYKANLSKADLSNADLSNAHLSYVNLHGATLHMANLRQADLRNGILSQADLSDANFSNAILNQANLSNAILKRVILYNVNFDEANLNGAQLIEGILHNINLRNANLSGTWLTYATLNNANLDKANLHGAFIGWTVFVKTNLSEVEGLETIKHLGPSSIGIDTVYQSKGNIPYRFLQDAGVPKNDIDSLLKAGKASDFYSCFICHSHKDEIFAAQLLNDLRARGVRCWYAHENLTIGEPFLLGIDKGIKQHDKFLLIFSENSINSGWVQHEVLAALAKEQGKEPWVIFPIHIDNSIINTSVPWVNLIKQSRHIGDFTQWKDPNAYQSRLERLLHDLKTTIEPERIIVNKTKLKSEIFVDTLPSLTEKIIAQLNEPNYHLIQGIVEIIGAERAEKLLQQVLAIEASGGQVTRDGTRRKTPGGVFISLAYAQATNGRERHQMLYYRQKYKT